MTIQIPEQTHGNVILYGDGDTIFLKGEIDDLDPGSFLTDFFEQTKEQMDEVVRIDFTELEFLNSSGIKCIVTFVMDKKPDSKVVFVTDSSKTWQKTSLEVIQSLDEDNIMIEE